MPPNRRMFWKVRATFALAAMLVVGHALEQELGAARLAQRDPALARLVEAGDAVEDGGLAGAVRADQRGDVAALGVERHVVHGDAGRRSAWSDARRSGSDRSARMLARRPSLSRAPRATRSARDRLALVQEDASDCRARHEAARPPDHDHHHGQAEDQHAVAAPGRSPARRPPSERQLAQESRCRRSSRPRRRRRRSSSPCRRARRSRRSIADSRKMKDSGLTKPWRVAKKEPAKPPNIAPMAKAVSLVLVVLMPSERQAISSSRSASQARPIGSLRSRSRHEGGEQREERGSGSRGRSCSRPS